MVQRKSALHSSTGLMFLGYCIKIVEQQLVIQSRSTRIGVLVMLRTRLDTKRVVD